MTIIDDATAALPESVASRHRVSKVPSLIRLEASTHCQLACPLCPTASGEVYPSLGKTYLTPENFERFLSANSKTLKRIELSNWGEAFMNPRLIEILKIADAYNVGLTLYNGMNLNNARAQTLEALVRYGLRGATCSLDGASNETYSIYRKRGNFEAVIENIERINFYKKKYNSVYPRLRWQFIIFGHNEHEIPAAKAMARRLNMKFVPKLNADPSYSPVRDADFVRRETGLKSVTRDELIETGEVYMADKMCSQLWNAVQINADGRILGCCMNYKSDLGGNAFENFLDAMNSEKIVYARAMVSDEAPPRDDIPCTTCSVYENRRPLKKLSPGRKIKQDIIAALKETLMGYDEVRWALAKRNLVPANFLNPATL